MTDEQWDLVDQVDQKITPFKIRPHHLHVIFFLFLHENICCGHSLEAPRRGTSNEYHNICFCREMRKISVVLWMKKVPYLLLWTVTIILAMSLQVSLD